MRKFPGKEILEEKLTKVVFARESCRSPAVRRGQNPTCGRDLRFTASETDYDCSSQEDSRSKQGLKVNKQNEETKSN